MRKNWVIGCVILSFILCAATLVVGKESIQAFIAECKLYYQKGRIDKLLEQPLISYNDYTYISLRDVSRLLSREVCWDAQEDEITLQQADYEQYMIQKKETALEIGKAILQEHYTGMVNEGTIYFVGYLVPTASWADNYYVIDAMFNPPIDRSLDLENDDDRLFFLNNSNVEVQIDPVTGSFTLYERNDSGQWEQVNNK